ncbi:heavy-metal-associated domain-containing protein [Halobacterium yunchengense]|uniref:heavy-metal-associated domain-containing protein n=1 Tax=Halobacterium yunchengense TaxID=3108497 RepID=UPI0030081F66
MAQTLTVRGMSCGGCESTVEDALRGVDGVTGASADRETDTATVEGDADPGALVAAVEDAGYDAAVAN